jgi:hypothetical protein
MLVPIRLWYGRRVRKRLVKGAQSALLSDAILATLKAMDEAEEWLGKLGVDDERSHLRQQLQNGRQAV